MCSDCRVIDAACLIMFAVAPLLACSQPRKTAAARAAPGPDAGAGGLAASLADLRASITQAAADQQHAQAAAAEAARLSEAAELAHAEAAAASRKARASAHKASLAAQTAAAAVAETPSASGGAAAVRPMPGVPASAPPAAISPAPASRPDAAQPASAGTQGVPPGPEVPKPDPAAAAGTASEAPAVAASDVDPTLDPTLVTRQDQVTPSDVTYPTLSHRAAALSQCGCLSLRAVVPQRLQIGIHPCRQRLLDGGEMQPAYHQGDTTAADSGRGCAGRYGCTARCSWPGGDWASQRPTPRWAASSSPPMASGCLGSHP